MFDEAAVMSMLSAEIRRFSERKDWKWQVRRDWAKREKPVNTSSIFDYEWKVVPPQEGLGGWYYVIRLKDERTLEFLHGNDWSPGSGMGGWWSEQHTSTVIKLAAIRELQASEPEVEPVSHSPAAQGNKERWSFELDRSRDKGSVGTKDVMGSIALSNWLTIMTDRYGPNFSTIT